MANRKVDVTTTPTKLDPKPTSGTRYTIQNVGSSLVYLSENATSPTSGFVLRPIEVWSITGGSDDFWVWGLSAGVIEIGG